MVKLYFIIGLVFVLLKVLFYFVLSIVLKEEFILTKTGWLILLIQWIIDIIGWPITMTQLVYVNYKLYTSDRYTKEEIEGITDVMFENYKKGDE